jgi:hypothetical protein
MHNIHSCFELFTTHGQDFVFARGTQCTIYPLTQPPAALLQTKEKMAEGAISFNVLAIAM